MFVSAEIAKLEKFELSLRIVSYDCSLRIGEEPNAAGSRCSRCHLAHCSSLIDSPGAETIWPRCID